MMADTQSGVHGRTTADLAGRVDLRGLTDGPRLVQGPQRDILHKTASPPTPLFAEPELAEFRSLWSDVHGGFADEPRRTIEQADTLVASVMQRLSEGFANERSRLEKRWDQGDKVSPKHVRVAVRRYRSFFDRLLRP
jgi:hypothetical protein